VDEVGSEPVSPLSESEVVVGAIYQLSFLTLGSTVTPGEDGFWGPVDFLLIAETIQDC
jgi:hypothetical protein